MTVFSMDLWDRWRNRSYPQEMKVGSWAWATVTGTFVCGAQEFSSASLFFFPMLFLISTLFPVSVAAVCSSSVDDLTIALSARHCNFFKFPPDRGQFQPGLCKCWTLYSNLELILVCFYGIWNFLYVQNHKITPCFLLLPSFTIYQRMNLNSWLMILLPLFLCEFALCNM